MESFELVGSEPRREGTAVLETFSVLLLKYGDHAMSQRDMNKVEGTLNLESGDPI